MPRTLKIGAGLSLPLDTVTSTLLVYGGKGMGKTNLLSVTLEEMSAAGLRWCSIDPVGVHWGLRHAADGKGEGVQCLRLGGVHGDIPIEPTGGEVVADLVADENVNVIIDCSRNKQGQMWSVTERTRFITAFARRIFMRQGSLVDGRRREPLFLALDEAARYIPQTIPHGNPDLSASLSAWEQLVEEGRNVGIGVGLFTQRSARINKSVAELADTMVAFRTTGPRSIDAIIEWLGEHVPKSDQRTMVEQVRKLPIGTALVVSPGWLNFEGVVAMRARQTFDSSATPKPGERARRVVGDGATVDLAAYERRMAETIERAKADDPRELRAQVKAAVRRATELERELQNAEREVENARSQQPVAAEPVKIRVFTEADDAALRAIADSLTPVHESLATVNDTMHGITQQVVGIFERATAHLKAHAAGLEVRVAAAEKKIAARTPPAPPGNVRRGGYVPENPPPIEGGPLSKGAAGLLLTLAKRHPMQMTRNQLATFAGRSIRSSSFRPHIQELLASGWAAETAGQLGLTPAGVEASGADAVQAQSADEVREMWRRALPPTAGRMLDALVAAYPREMSRDELCAAAQVSPTSSGVGSALRHLRVNGLLMPDVLRATDEIAGD